MECKRKGGQGESEAGVELENEGQGESKDEGEGKVMRRRAANNSGERRNTKLRRSKTGTRNEKFGV